MQRIDKILMAQTDIVDPVQPKSISINDCIRYNDVWFKYKSEKESSDEKWVLKGIDLEIKKGKTVAIVGQSGSGKSTLVDLLPRFYDIQKGCITIDGTDIRDVLLFDLRSLMGNVNQEAILLTIDFQQQCFRRRKCDTGASGRSRTNCKCS